MSTVGAQAFADRVWGIIDIHRTAEDLSVAEAIGVLDMIKLDLYRENLSDESADELEEGYYDDSQDRF